MNRIRVAALLRELASLADRYGEGPPDEQLIGWSRTCELRGQREAVPHVYFVTARHAEAVKIGWTSGPTQERIVALQTGCPTKLTALFTFRGTMVLERSMHARFAKHRTHSEWFTVDGDLAVLFGLCSLRLLHNDVSAMQ